MPGIIICSFSRTIAAWLSKKFPRAVSLDSSGAGNEEIIRVLLLLLPAVEFHAITNGHYNLCERIKQISGLKNKSDQLSWLIDLFNQSELPDPVKDELYGQLKVFVKWKHSPAQTPDTCLPLHENKPWKQEKFIKTIRINNITRIEIKDPSVLDANEKMLLLDVMKTSLAMNYRETDPVTHANAEDILLFDMGRGLKIALVGMQINKRLSLESYMGYMAFKNGTPVAYGGGWIWGTRCRVGISIYPAYRKGESSWLFGQVLRLFYQYYNARHFIIMPNQFGKDNRDGLKSGAFWFYYKLGFRSSDKELRKLAEVEWKKIKADKSYRSSLDILKLFTGSSLERKLGNAFFSKTGAETISQMISEMINNEYDGSRKNALRSVRIQFKEKLKPVKWPSQQKPALHHFENWSLLLNMLPGFSKWDQHSKKQLLELIQVKQSGNERDHISGMQKLSVFWKSLEEMEKVWQVLSSNK